MLRASVMSLAFKIVKNSVLLCLPKEFVMYMKRGFSSASTA